MNLHILTFTYPVTSKVVDILAQSWPHPVLSHICCLRKLTNWSLSLLLSDPALSSMD